MSTTEEAVQERERQRQHQREQTREQARLQEAFNANGDLSRDWMQEILDTDDLEERLQPGTIKKIQGMLNVQWVVANLTGAETHDRTYWLEVQRYKILGEHPPEGSTIHGDIRAFLYDDEWENLQALTAGERNTIDQIIKSLQNMVTRSREGFERQQINTNIARTESEDNTKSDGTGGALRGLFE